MEEAVSYTRYSSHSQRDVSIEQQRRAIEAYAARNGLTLVGHYEDHALTGTNDKRPGFQKMIRDAEHSSWRYIIVYSLDRFARDRYDSAVYKRQLKNSGVKVLSAMEQISDDPTGILMESLLEGLAEYYSKELSQKIRRGMNDNAQKCLVIGKLPLGYNRAADGSYAVNDAEAAVVREIFERVNAGDKLSVIVSDLNERCIKTKAGNTWSVKSFSKMLTNDAYIGTYRHCGITVEDGIPSIIGKPLFYSVQDKLSSKKNPRATRTAPQRRKSENGIYILTGKIFCGKCKEPMVGLSGRSHSGVLHSYYVCKGKRQDHSCDKKNVPRDLIEAAVARSLRATMLTDEAINALADAAMEYQAAQQDSFSISALESQLKETQVSLNNLMRAIEAGIITETTQSRLLELEQIKKQLTARIEYEKSTSADLLTKEEITTALRFFQRGDITDKSYQEALIDAFLKAVYVYDDKLRIVFHLNNDSPESEIPFDIDSVCIDSPTLHQIFLYKPVAFVDGYFIYEEEFNT